MTYKSQKLQAFLRTALNRIMVILVIIPLLSSSGFSQPDKRILYKQIDTINLYMDVYLPDEFNSDTSYPAIVFYFGGGWNSGNVGQFFQHAKYFASRGLISFLVDYRVNSRHQTSPFESLMDAKSAIRYIRENASAFQVDTSKIIASGGSAGGQLAAATALISHHNEESDDLSVSCIPNALVLFNPAIDNGPGGLGYDRIGGKYKNFSPLHNIREGAPPTIIFLGTEDILIPVVTMQYYKIVMEKVGSRCDLVLYEGEGHGFFNYRNFEHYKKTILEADEFLTSIGFLKRESIEKFE